MIVQMHDLILMVLVLGGSLTAALLLVGVLWEWWMRH